jgi:hypothetical protein
MNWKNIEGNSWDSFNYKSSGHLCEDGYDKFGDWYKTKSDYKKGIELHHRLSEKEFEKVDRFDGQEYIENNVDSGYRGHLSEKIRFLYNDFTFDDFERDFESFKKKQSNYFYKWTISHYTQRLNKI